jgi:hypothetical protein
VSVDGLANLLTCLDQTQKESEVIHESSPSDEATHWECCLNKLRRITYEVMNK